MRKSNRFCPAVESLEGRRLMAGDVGDVVADTDHQEVGLLLPAVQAAREAARGDTHTYATGGIFTITVTVTDDDTGQAIKEGTDDYFASLGGQQDGHEQWIPVESVSVPIYR